MDKVNLQYFSILKSLVWLSENLSSFNPNNDNFDNKKVDGGVWKRKMSNDAIEERRARDLECSSGADTLSPLHQGPASTQYSTQTRNLLSYSNSTRTKHYLK